MIVCLLFYCVIRNKVCKVEYIEKINMTEVESF